MRQQYWRFVGLLACLLCVGPRGGMARAQSTIPASEFFESRIRPLLSEKCFACHGPSKQRADLRLDSHAAMLKGGESGQAAVIAGQPAKSLLMKAVRHETGAPKMPPPPKAKLSNREIADLSRWIESGANLPDVANSNAGGDGKLWSFVPPCEQTIPAVKDAAWPRAPLDRFVLAGLEAKGIAPAAPADKRSLIRRAAFDLTGLPPSPREVEAYLSDAAPAAFAKVVERLLASPHYGERWGRHWLDVARYADSNGLDENVAFGNAWRYRDYVVSAFNHDKPFDHFVLEQIAGDLLPAGDRHERLIATGFLSLGPKVLAEVDAKKMEMDIIDEQVDTVGRGFLALTLGCARCHNHKFDPISTEDYYGLVGIFQSTKSMEHFKKIARWHENTLASDAELKQKSALDQKIAANKAQIAGVIRKADEQIKTAAAKPGATGAKTPEEKYPPAVRDELKRLRDQLALLEKSVPALTSAMGVIDGAVADAPVFARGNHLAPGKKIDRRFPIALAGERQPVLSGAQSGRLELANWLTRPDHPLTGRVMVNRIWRWHFGQGLVRSTDNFGRLGERPSNQPLFDWLARRFIAEGWSVKAMHRLIMNSSTYQMSTAWNAAAAAVDPENRLHWRANPRRLEAEALRDAVLAVSGTLDRTMGGSLLHVGNREYLFDHTSLDKTRYDSLRRSLYLPLIRNNLYDVFGLFDATDATVPSGDRATTTVATQALFWMNSDLVTQATERLAQGLLAQTGTDDASRLRSLYLRVYGRPPTPIETARGLAAIAEFSRPRAPSQALADAPRAQAWTWLCHILIAANEFAYVN